MMSSDNWSQLITVNYKGGWGGDFFSTLLDSNFNQSKFVNNSFYKYEYFNCPFNNLPKLFSIFYNFFNKIDTNNAHPDMIDYENYSISLLSKILSVYHQPNQQLETTLKYYFFDNYKHNFNNIIRVTNCHNLNDLMNSRLDLHQVFPKSHNIKYYTTNKPLSDFFQTIIYMHKISPIKFYIEELKRDFIKQILPNEENCLYVDSYELIFCDKNYDKILSDFCNMRINLDYNRVQKYKQQLVNILNKYNIKIDKQYDINLLFDITEKIYYERQQATK